MPAGLSHACAVLRGLAVAGLAVSAAAQTLTVTTLHDVIDFGGARQVSRPAGAGWACFDAGSVHRRQQHAGPADDRNRDSHL